MLGTANALDAPDLPGVGAPGFHALRFYALRFHALPVDALRVDAPGFDAKVFGGNGYMNQIGSGAGGETTGLLPPHRLVAELQG
jgi:hypothetical protein